MSVQTGKPDDPDSELVIGLKGPQAAIERLHDRNPERLAVPGSGDEANGAWCLLKYIINKVHCSDIGRKPLHIIKLFRGKPSGILMLHEREVSFNYGTKVTVH